MKYVKQALTIWRNALAMATLVGIVFHEYPAAMACALLGILLTLMRKEIIL